MSGSCAATINCSPIGPLWLLLNSFRLHANFFNFTRFLSIRCLLRLTAIFRPTHSISQQLPMILEILVCSILVRSSIQCLTTGVCGGGGFCAPPPALPCQPSSCQPGYSCGQYGCARNRARSALTKKIDGVFIGDDSEESTPLPRSFDLEEGFIEERNIYGMNRAVGKAKPSKPITTRELMDNATLGKLMNPNFIFRQCCEQRGLPDACLSKCHFNTYTRDALQSMYFKSDGCPIEATADMHFCAAQGRDHTECCRRNGVTTTLAGYKCLTFCDQRPDKITKLDYSYVPCYDRFEQMKQCFYTDIREKARRQYGTR
ncbi:hypothetical protein V3C99_002485 [Haemonchus contortus]